MKAIPFVIFFGVLVFGGCASSSSKVMTKNWCLAEIESIVYACPEIKKETRFRSIEIKDKDSLIVYMGDYGFLSGGGQKVYLKIQQNGKWKVMDISSFDS
jgi:hypothetical protein